MIRTLLGSLVRRIVPGGLIRIWHARRSWHLTERAHAVADAGDADLARALRRKAEHHETAARPIGEGVPQAARPPN